MLFQTLRAHRLLADSSQVDISQSDRRTFLNIGQSVMFVRSKYGSSAWVPLVAVAFCSSAFSATSSLRTSRQKTHHKGST